MNPKGDAVLVTSDERDDYAKIMLGSCRVSSAFVANEINLGNVNEWVFTACDTAVPSGYSWNL